MRAASTPAQETCGLLVLHEASRRQQWPTGCCHTAAPGGRGIREVCEASTVERLPWLLHRHNAGPVRSADIRLLRGSWGMRGGRRRGRLAGSPAPAGPPWACGCRFGAFRCFPALCQSGTASAASGRARRLSGSSANDLARPGAAGGRASLNLAQTQE